MFLVWSLAEQGNFVNGVEHSKEAVRIAERNGQPGNLIHAYLAVGYILLYRGEVASAMQSLKRALEVSETWSLPFFLPWISSAIGYCHLLSGHVADGLIRVNAGLEQATSMNVMAYHPLWLVYLSEGYLLEGRVDDAERVADRAVSLSIQQKEEGSRATALCMRGAVAAHRAADVEQAAKHYHDAMIVATGLGMRPLVAHCHLGLGKLYRRPGKSEQAQEHLATATTMYREMDMRFWLAQAEAEMMKLK